MALGFSPSCLVFSLPFIKRVARNSLFRRLRIFIVVNDFHFHLLCLQRFNCDALRRFLSSPALMCRASSAIFRKRLIPSLLRRV